VSTQGRFPFSGRRDVNCVSVSARSGDALSPQRGVVEYAGTDPPSRVMTDSDVTPTVRSVRRSPGGRAARGERLPDAAKGVTVFNCGRSGRLSGMRRATALAALVFSLACVGASWGATTYDPASDPYSMDNITTGLGASSWWDAGYTGKGVDVALIDTGVS